MSRANKTRMQPAPATERSVRAIRGVASLSLQARDGVLYAQASGLVTMAGAVEIYSEMAPAMGESLAACLDYSRTLLAITEDELDLLYRTPGPGPQVLAMAWVVPDETTAELWQGQVDRFAMVGLRRFVTHHPQDAQEWATEQARSAAADRQQHRQRRAQP